MSDGDDELLARLRAGEPAAAEAFVRRFGGAMFAAARRLLANEEDARDALQDAGIRYDEHLVVESSLQLEDGRNSMLKLLALKRPPDAVFSSSAYGAMGALQILKENKVRVPGQIALVAFSNEPFTSFTDPALTTVDQHPMRMGNAAAAIFLQEIATKNSSFVPQKIVLKPELIVRASSLKNVSRES